MPFDRPVLLVASLHAPVTVCLKRFLSLFLGQELPHHFPMDNALTLTCAEDIHTYLDKMERRELFNAVCVVDLTLQVQPQWNINKIDEGLHPEELVLRYPEIYWIFLVVNEHQTPKEMICEDRDCHFVKLDNLGSLLVLLSRHAQGFRTWFDPAGLRRLTRGEARPMAYGAAIDDEVSYAILNGYVLYRNHRATYVVSSLAELENVQKRLEKEKNLYIMEDLELRFGDANDDLLKEKYLQSSEGIEPLDVLKGRGEKFSMFRNAAYRLIVSLELIKMSGEQRFGTAIKPYGGMFAPELKKVRDDTGDKTESPGAPPDHGHGAPFRAQQVAEALLVRARRLERETPTIRRAIHIALLANEARHLLSNKTLALSLEALAIQQRMEVTAECAFIGIASQLAVKDRFKEIEDEIHKMIGKGKKEYQVNSACLKIVDNLRQVYKHFDQFPEEDEAIKRMRDYEWKLKYSSSRPVSGSRNLLSKLWSGAKRILLVALGLPEYYFNVAMKGFPHLASCIFVWISIFTLIYYFKFPDTTLITLTQGKEEVTTFFDWFIHSAVTFISLQQGIASDPKILDIKEGVLVLKDSCQLRWFWRVTIAETVLGFVHVGILVSYLFQKISRR